MDGMETGSSQGCRAIEEARTEIGAREVTPEHEEDALEQAPPTMADCLSLIGDIQLSRHSSQCSGGCCLSGRAWTR